jgi:hypothetical protein
MGNSGNSNEGRVVRKNSRTEITIETQQLLVIREPGDSVRGTCPQCGPEVRLVSSNQAAVLAGESTRTIYRWIEDGLIHFTETREGHLFVCLASLPLLGEVEDLSN